jgi:hypothetical protein
MNETSGELSWYTSSYSNGEGSCVEFAVTPAGNGAVRDTKDRKAGTFLFPKQEWNAFLSAVKDGTFGV